MANMSWILLHTMTGFFLLSKSGPDQIFTCWGLASMNDMQLYLYVIEWEVFSNLLHTGI